MEKNFMEYISKWIKIASEPMMASSAAPSPDLSCGKDIKAVIFDIYGTLVVSASGDINEYEFSTESLKKSLTDAGIHVREEYEGNERGTLLGLMNEYVRTIHAQLERHKADGIKFPEIIVEEIWEAVICNNKSLFKQFKSAPDFKRLAFVFEVLSNRIYPMPRAMETIAQLHKEKIPLGIISNAQFYTPIIMNYFFSDKVSRGEEIDCFDPDLVIFSYKKKRSKPDSSLFEIAARNLRRKYSIAPENALFVGNDMYKDIYPAKNFGFSTAFFAGDKRSCRFRKDMDETKGIKPDYILTELRQILEIVRK
jgi:putative hydrolase of the HAD superfamily